MTASTDDSEDNVGLMREALEEIYSKPREGCHVSAIVSCPKLHVFKCGYVNCLEWSCKKTGHGSYW